MRPNYLFLFVMVLGLWNPKAHGAPQIYPVVTTTHASDGGQFACHMLSRGGGFLPGGMNPLGYRITDLGLEFLKYDGSRESDIGVLLSSLKSGRKRFATIKEQWLEVLRVSKSGQTMRVYRQLQEIIDFCVKAGLVD